MMPLHRRHPAYWAFLAHRLSGLGLALFLPLHFYTLGLALRRDALEDVIAWSGNPAVKLAETALVVMLAVHAAGGLRLLAVEFLPWSERQNVFICAAFGAGLLAGLLFLLNAA